MTITSDLTIGGTNASTLTATSTKAILTVGGNVSISTANGTLSTSRKAMTIAGNLTVNGSFVAGNNGTTIFSGVSQVISGSAASLAFEKMTINAGTTVILQRNIITNNTVAINGTLDPGNYSINNASGVTTLGSGSILYVSNAAGLAGIYSSTITQDLKMSAGSTVYYSASVNQAVTSFTYSNLIITNSNTCTLGGNVTINGGNVSVNAGTLDLASFTLNRSAAGGVFTASAATVIKIQNASGFPSNFTTYSIASTNTVEYNGAAQVVASQPYGNLILSGSGNKSTSTTSFVVSSDLTLSGSAIFSPSANITANGSITIGSGTIFNGGTALSHTFTGSLVNNGGTLNGNTSTIAFSGTNKSISGSGTYSFNNLTVSGFGATVSPTTNFTVGGNLTSTGAGSLIHTPGGAGTVTISGNASSVSGTGITFNNLTVSGTTVTTAASFTVAGDLSISGGFTASNGTITLNGSSKTIGGTGTTLQFQSLTITGSVATTRNFSIASNLSVSGTLTASAGTATFNGISTLSGTANLFNAILNGTSLQLGSGSTLGIAGSMSLIAGTLNVTSTIPNTVNFNGAGGQSIPTAGYNNLTLSSSGSISAIGNTTIYGDLTIGSSTNFVAGSSTYSLYGNFINNGTYTAGTDILSLLGPLDVILSGVTTFNVVNVNKSSSANIVTLGNNITVNTVNMISGNIHTDNNTFTITTSTGRTGNGIIIGTVTRTHAFSIGTAYEFEGPFNTITFSAASGVSSVTVTTNLTVIADFTFGSGVNREYTISVTGTSYTAALRLHYEEGELNGNSETGLDFWHYTSDWTTYGKSANSTVDNWVELDTLTSIDGRWALSEFVKVVRWTGSVSTEWENNANWIVLQGSPSLPPSATDVVQLGDTVITNQPTIHTAATVRGIQFGSAAAVTLTIANDSLTTIGNIDGLWNTNRTHSIEVGANKIRIGGNLTLSDNTSGHDIGLSIGSGSVIVSGSLTQSGNAAVALGSGMLRIGTDYIYSAGTFTAGTGTVVYDGSTSQTVAGGFSYYNLIIDKAASVASLSAFAPVNNTLSVISGTFSPAVSVPVTGDVSIGSGAAVNGGSITLSVGGNWTNSGTFNGGSGTVTFNGTGTQTISASAFNNVIINKSTGTAILAGNISLNGDLTVSSGTLDLAAFTANRTAAGGSFSIASGTTLLIGGSANFPTNYSAYSFAAASTVTYNGSSVQTISDKLYGNLTLFNGGSNAKSLSGMTTVVGDLTISTGSTLDAGTYTMSIEGNMFNSGSFTPSTGSVQLSGASMLVSGTTTFHTLSVSGSYTLTNAIIVESSLQVSGTLNAGTSSLTLSGDVTNTGTISSSGTITISGTSSQIIAFNSGFSSSGELLMNGTVSPSFSGGSSPSFNNVTINNTGGIAPGIGWTFGGAFTVASGAAFTGGGYSHIFNGSFTNNGSVSSSGTLTLSPSTAVTINLLGTSFTSTGTVVLGGTGLITLASGSPTLANLVISNSNAAGVSFVNGLTIGGDLTIGSSATLHAGASSHTLVGNLNVNGTLDGGTSTITFNNSINKSVSASGIAKFYHLTVASSSSVTISSNISIEGNLTNNGTMVNDGIVLTLSGSANASIATSSLAFSIDQLNIAKTSASVTLAKDISSVASLSITSGTFDQSTFAITEESTDKGSIWIGPNTLFTIGGTNSFPTFTNGYTIDASSTTEYNGTTQLISSAPSYASVIISSSGTKTISNAAYSIGGSLSVSAGTITGGGNSTVLTIGGDYLQSGGSISLSTASQFIIAGDVNISSGTFAPSVSAQTHSIGGNWSMSGGTFTNTNSTIQFNGSSAQTVSTTGDFNNFTIDKTSGSLTIVSDSVRIAGVLAFTNGKITTGVNKIVLTSTGSVSGSSSAKYVVGNLQKRIPNTSAVTFEVGDASNYTPAVVQFTSLTAVGELVIGTTSGDHPDIVNSGINPSKSVNRYWNLEKIGNLTGIYSVLFTFVNGDVDAGASTGSFKISKKDASWNLQTTTGQNPTSTQATGVISFGVFQIGETGKIWNGSVDNNWNTASNWTPSGAPLSTDVVILGGSDSINVNSTGECLDLQIGNASMRLTILSGNSLTAAGNLTMTAGTLRTESAFPSVAGTVLLTGGTVKYSGTNAQTVAKQNYYNLEISGIRGANNITLAGDTIRIAGTFSTSASFTSGTYVITSNTMEYNGTSEQTISPFNYNNLLISGSRTTNFVTLSSSGTIGVFDTFSPTATFSTGGFVITSSTFNFNGSGAQTVPAFNYHHLSISGDRGGNSVTLSSTDTVAIAGTFTPILTGTSYIQSGVIFEFNGNSAQSLPAFTYNSIVFSGSGIKTISSNITSNNDFINRAGSAVNIGNISVQINGTLNNAGSIVNNGTIQTGN